MVAGVPASSLTTSAISDWVKNANTSDRNDQNIQNRAQISKLLFLFIYIGYIYLTGEWHLIRKASQDASAACKCRETQRMVT
jgi:hypothetical protein